MGRRPADRREQGAAVVDAALEAMSAGELRGQVRDLLLELDDRTYGRVVSGLIDRAARNGSGWAPAGPSQAAVEAIVAFAEAARRAGEADAAEVDGYLREGTNAFLGRSYPTAFRIFRALLLPLGRGDIYLGQAEMVDEALGCCLATCAAQYVVSMYMTAAPAHRAEAVHAAIEDVRGVHSFWAPLREMEKVAIEPLPGLEDFLPAWRALVEEKAAAERRDEWDRNEDCWLREVVQRIQGAEGLAGVARSTRRADDLRAWCQALVKEMDWAAALDAYEEAAQIVQDKDWSLGEFLDGVALAAQELGRSDLPERLEPAWRLAPSFTRLLRWLGTATSQDAMENLATEALEGCPDHAVRQRALCYIIVGDYLSAARLLAEAPGLGWSGSEHPGHMLWSLFIHLLGGSVPRSDSNAGPDDGYGRDINDPRWTRAGAEMPRLDTPEVGKLLEQAGTEGLKDKTERSTLIAAMRQAAEKRVAGVTENKRRRHYSHAAWLVATCAALDPSAETAGWVSGIRTEYRRFPALQREFNNHLGRE